MYFRREGWIWKKRYSRLSSTPALSSLDEPAWEPLPAGVSERRRDLPEPRGSVAGGVRGVGGVVAAQVRTSHTPGSSAEVNWRGPEMNDLFWIFFFLKTVCSFPLWLTIHWGSLTCLIYSSEETFSRDLWGKHPVILSTSLSYLKFYV